MNRTVIAITRFAIGACLAVVVAGCEAEKSRNPLSPNVAGPIPGVSISPPTPVNPVNAEVLNTAPVRLVFNNATTNGERPLSYIVELASDAAFANKVFAQSKVTPGSGSQTTIVVDASLAADRTYYWRAKADDGANESAYSSVAKFDVVVPIVIETPGPVSPVSGAVTSSTRPTLVANNAGIQGRVGRVDYWFEVALDQAFARIIVGLGVERSGGTTTSAPMPELPGNTLLYWRVVGIGLNGTVTGSWSLTQSFRTPASAPAPTPPPSPGPNPPPIPGSPGCINGVLADPRAYFFALIGRAEGSPAGDWATVLTRSGLPAGPVRGVRVPSNAPFYGITQQINSSGQVRGRLFLPTEMPDGTGYYIHQVDILSDASANHWVWQPHGDQPPYVPRRCP